MTLFDTLKLGSLSVPSRIFMVTRPRCEFFYTVTFNLACRGPRHVPGQCTRADFQVDEASAAFDGHREPASPTTLR